MCRLEEEMQQARKEFAAEKQKLTEELVSHCKCICYTMYVYVCNGLLYRMELNQRIRLKWTKTGR